MSNRIPLTCNVCMGSGQHPKCLGRGFFTKLFDFDCTECNRTGKCLRCFGKGRVWIKKKK